MCHYCGHYPAVGQYCQPAKSSKAGSVWQNEIIWHIWIYLFAVISRLFSKENAFLLCIYFNIRSYVNGRWGLWCICRQENMDFYNVCCQLIIKTVQKIYTCCSSLSADLIKFFYLFEVFHWLPGADLCRMQHTQLQWGNNEVNIVLLWTHCIGLTNGLETLRSGDVTDTWTFRRGVYCSQLSADIKPSWFLITCFSAYLHFVPLCFRAKQNKCNI